MGGRTTGERGYGYWFPLVLLGFGLLTLLANDNLRTDDGFGWFAYTPEGPGSVNFVAVLEPGAQYHNTPLPFDVEISTRDWTWTALIVVTLVGAVAWYAVRARRAGRSVRGHVALAVGGVVAVLACKTIAAIAAAVSDDGEMVRSVALPLVGLGVLAGAYHWLGPRRRVAAVIGVVCLLAGASALLGAWAYGLADPLIITGGLLILARYERSRLVALLSVVLLVALLVFPYGILSTLVPAVIVLAGAVAALVRRGGAPAPA